MLTINFMQTFLNRLKDRGWKNNIIRGYTDADTQALNRGDDNVIVVKNINIDPSVDLTPQIEGFFKELIKTIYRSKAKTIFLPGGGNIPIPEFFIEFCGERGIEIHIIDLESIRKYMNYN